eukprot:COSAG06_NODE_42337_length_382_cov_2.342756_1_plen_65_part_01
MIGLEVPAANRFLNTSTNLLAIILLHSENRGLNKRIMNKRISESEASPPPARPAAAPCRRHHGIR